jgi:hypothetical protein
VKGEARRRGEGWTSVLPACPGMPLTPREEEALRQGVGWRAEFADCPAAPSARGEGAGGILVGLAPSQPESEREVLTPRGIAAD